MARWWWEKKKKREGTEEDGVQWQRKGCRLIETIDDAFFQKSPPPLSTRLR